mmetsp:Transcript_16926/g.28188  ORF Transcript_16926/g.28188 Transcript_16926/m.28188 type:complete len:284 (+) Transcript_16926:124-975(+)|eukprot:CAMPEP_0119321896 /NCGR_PEP_ID=MMETSP1333-20130426/56731_1 /TAXON_ID=418940 /ORGANISM="Scyphosphaera apsteinii, Strain RCC1455" /LENGTH=283 /DNA_ID=CAMNT_0007328985 /DNA_START=124 /DNA_END=975 /DNA_ORIENTATION=-
MREDAETTRASNQRGSRTTRRYQADDSAAANQANHDAADGADEDSNTSSGWQQEMDSICAGTHPALVAELKKHEQVMQSQIAQAERVRNNQTANIRNLFECDKKQIDDEYKAQLQFFQNRLIDSIEQKQRKAARQTGFRLRRPTDSPKQAEKRKKLGSTGLYESFGLKAEDMKVDLDDILRNVDHYSVRTAALASDDLRHNTGDVWFDRSRQLLHFNGQSIERGSSVLVYQQGQRVDEQWTITAMNAVEVTLRDADGTKLKVTLSQLRNGRYAFRPAESKAWA